MIAAAAIGKMRGASYFMEDQSPTPKSRIITRREKIIEKAKKF
jgi:hypothetical protein